MTLGRDVVLGPGDIVLDGDPALPPPERGTAQQPQAFRPMSIVAKQSPISATAELCFPLCMIVTVGLPSYKTQSIR